MNLSKSNNSNSNTNVVQSNSRDGNVPRFPNRNLNNARGVSSTGLRTGPPKPAVQVIQAKQKLGKAVGAAALPPTPLNTPSLKRETQTNQTAPWNGSTQDEGSPSLKGLSGPAKPAPWAKPGNTVEVEKSEEPKVEITTAKQATRSWANADDSDDEDRQENPPETEWPDNFRDAVEDLPPAKSEQYDSHEGEFASGGHRYVPPYVRNNRPVNSRENEERRTYHRNNNDDHDNFYDNRYISSSGNRSHQFAGNTRQVERIDRDFGGRNDNARRDHRVHEESGYIGRDGGFPEQRNQRSSYRGDEDREGDNRVSSRFNYELERPAYRGDRNDRYERNEGGDGNYRVTRPPVSGSQYENRGVADNRGYRSNDYPDTRYPPNRYSRDPGYSEQSHYQGKRYGGGFVSRQVGGREDDDSNYRDRSRTMSEDFQQKPGYLSGNKSQNSKETHDAPRPEDTVDLKDIETSRREAEYLEQRKSKPISSDRPSDRRTEFSKEESLRQPTHQETTFRQGDGFDSRRSTGLQNQSVGNSRQNLDQTSYDHSNQNYDSRLSENLNYGSNVASSNNRTVGTEDTRWRSNNRPGGLSSNFPKQAYGGLSDRDIIPDYNPARRELGGYDSNVAGAYRGQDAVKLSFPQHHGTAHEDQVYHSESYSPPHYSSNRGQEFEYQSSRQNQTGWREEPQSRIRDNQLAQQSPLEMSYEADMSRNVQKVAINPVSSREDDLRGNRPRQLYDPKSDQLIDSDESRKGKMKAASVSKEVRQVEKPVEPEKWQKILQKTDSEEQLSRSVIKDSLVVERPKSDVVVAKVDPKQEELDKAQKAKLERQRERLNREPRTKGFLYRYTETGELERVLSKWEMEQEELERKKSLNVDEMDDSFSDRVAVLKKKSDSIDHAGVRTTHTPSISDFPQDSKRQRDSNESRGLSAISGSTNVGVVGTDNQGNSTGSNILGTLMQGSSLFDSWNRPNHNTLSEDSRGNSDLTGPNRMTWLTGSQNSSNPAFASGLSSLGSGLAGIISSSSNVSSSLFPNTQQDWSYNTILSNDTGNTSLNPVYSGNSLNEINRQSSFSPFSGIPINLQESVIQSEKKDGQYSTQGLRHPEDASGTTNDNRNFIQREWQRFQANAFGAVGNKPTNAKSSRPSSVDSPVLEITNNPTSSSVLVANQGASNSGNSKVSSNVSPVVSKSMDSDGGRNRELNEIHHLPPSRKEEDRETNRGGRGQSRELSQSGGRGDHSRRSQPGSNGGDRQSMEGSNRGGRGRENRSYPSNPSQRSPPNSSDVPTTTSFHTRITNTGPSSSRASSDNRNYREISDSRSKNDSSVSHERRRDEPSSSSYDDDYNIGSSNDRDDYNRSQGSSRRSYSGGSNNIGSGYNSGSRSSSQYSSGGRGRGGYNNTNSSGRNGGGRGYSGPRAQSEVLSHSKSNDANESSNKNTTNN